MRLAVAATTILTIWARLADLANGQVNCPDTCDPLAVQTLDGCCNHLTSPGLGALGQEFRRLAPAAYPGDGSGDDIAETSVDGSVMYRSERVISNAVFNQPDPIMCSSRGISELHTFHGQFWNHDGHKATTTDEADLVVVPIDDPHFTVDMPVTRTNIVPGTGTSADNPRQQGNTGESAVLDLSVVYGLTEEGLEQLRGDKGRLLTSRYAHGDFPPPGTSLENPEAVETMPADGPAFADVRGNENPGLMVQHTLSVRNHNYWAREFRQQFSDAEMSDEEVFQLARRVNIAEHQRITAYEWLPALGLELEDYDAAGGYNPDTPPIPVSEMVVGALRFGHTMLRDDIEMRGTDFRRVVKTLSLKDAFFAPDEVTGGLLAEGERVDTSTGGIEAMIRGQVSRCSNEIDSKVIDAVRNFLFGEGSGLDLTAFNLFRARDWGIARYNVIREAVGLSAATSFADITSDASVQAELASVYDSVEDVDFWVGGLAEDHGAGKSLGPLFEAIFLEHFRTMRHGDRFWFENVGSIDASNADRDAALRRRVKRSSYRDFLARNTDIDREDLPENPFFVRESGRGDGGGGGGGGGGGRDDGRGDGGRGDGGRDDGRGNGRNLRA